MWQTDRQTDRQTDIPVGLTQWQDQYTPNMWQTDRQTYQWVWRSDRTNTRLTCDRQTDRHTSGSDAVTGPTHAQTIGSRVLNIAAFCIDERTDTSNTHTITPVLHVTVYWIQPAILVYKTSHGLHPYTSLALTLAVNITDYVWGSKTLTCLSTTAQLSVCVCVWSVMSWTTQHVTDHTQTYVCTCINLHCQVLDDVTTQYQLQ